MYIKSASKHKISEKEFGLLKEAFEKGDKSVLEKLDRKRKNVILNTKLLYSVDGKEEMISTNIALYRKSMIDIKFIGKKELDKIVETKKVVETKKIKEEEVTENKEVIKDTEKNEEEIAREERIKKIMGE